MPPPAYTDEQVDRYLELIQIPQQYRRESNPSRDLEFLKALHNYHLTAIPYENLLLHYSEHHQVSLDPEDLFKKLLAGRRRGGYCMEVAIFYNHILRALGFRAYLAGVRIRNRIIGTPTGPYRGFTHVVNLVILEDGSKWHVDIGFGGDGATKPLPLVPDIVTRNIGTQDLRLIKGNIDDQTEETDKLWIYQYRNSPDHPWNSFYAFSELEFLPKDFEGINYYVSNSPASFQTTTVLAVKFLRRKVEGAENGEEEIYGKVMLINGEFKLNTGGKTTVVKVCQKEEERVDALKEYFGIDLTDEEKNGIRMWSTEIK